MKKKLFTVVSLLLASALCLTACGGSGSGGTNAGKGEKEEEQIGWQDSHVSL